MENTYIAIVDLFDNLIHDAQGRMYEYINFKQDQIRISAPDFIIDFFKKGLSFKFMLNEESRSVGKDFVYRGLIFVPSYELEIAVWHKDYPLYKKEWMLRKISLNPAYKTKNHLYDEYLLKISPLTEIYCKTNKTQFN